MSNDVAIAALGLPSQSPDGNEVGSLWRELNPRERRAWTGIGRVLIETRDEQSAQPQPRPIRRVAEPTDIWENAIELEPEGNEPRAAHTGETPTEEWSSEGEDEPQ